MNTIEIGEDTACIRDSESNTITFAATGGPEDSVEVSVRKRTGGGFAFHITTEQLGTLQLAFVNFSNTGYFNQEG